MGRIFQQTKEEFLEDVKYDTEATVVCDKNNVIILQVKNWEDASYLFDCVGINWCIAQSRYHWNEYVRYNCCQYFLVDFNSQGLTSNYSLIGFTVNNKGILEAAHAKNDEGLMVIENNEMKFYKELKKKKVYDEYLVLTGQKPKAKKAKEASLSPVVFLIISIIVMMCVLTCSEVKKKNVENGVKTSQMRFPVTNGTRIGFDEKISLDGFKMPLDSFTMCNTWKSSF